MKPKTVLATLGIAILMAASAPPPSRAAEPIERLTAFAVDTSELAGRTRAGTIEIAIERWSTDEERPRCRCA